NLERTDIAGRRWKCLVLSSTDNQQILVNHWRACQRDKKRAYIAAQAFTQINPALVTKARNRLASVRIQRIQEIHDAHQNAAVVPALPVGKPSIRLCALDARIKFPFQLPRGSIDSEYFLRWRDSIEHPVHHDGAGLQPASLLRIEPPGDLQLLYVVSINLFQFGVVPAFRSTAIHGPIPVAAACELKGD